MKRSHIVALIIIALCIGIIVSMVADSSSYETFATARSVEGKKFHVVGTLSKDREMVYEPAKDVNYFSFYMSDKKGEERQVIFRGTKPQDFEHSEQIVLTGRMDGDNFLASKILMKCPSKYVKDDEIIVEESAS